MKILYLPVGGPDNPGTRLRVHAVARVLRARGHQVAIHTPRAAAGSAPPWRWVGRAADLLGNLAAAPRADVVVVYRKSFPGPAAALLGRLARHLVLEFDDAIWLPSPGEAASGARPGPYRRNFAAMVGTAELVLAGSRFLAEHSGHPRVEVVPTAVDLETFRPEPAPPPGQGAVIGWIGTRENHPQWQRLVPVFRRLLDACPGVSFKVISDAEFPASDLPVRFERFALAREAACLAEVDIGLMPLSDDEWSRGKCGVKALQHMAMAQPVVLSPVGANRDIVEHGVSGWFATTESEWLDALVLLVRDPERRAQMGAAARQVVEQRYSLSVIAARVAGLLEALAPAG